MGNPRQLHKQHRLKDTNTKRKLVLNLLIIEINWAFYEITYSPERHHACTWKTV